MNVGSIVSPYDTVANETLDGVVVSARLADTRISSLRIVNIGSDRIRTNSTGRTFPELIRNIPGVYSTSETGSFGDARINIRGFKQENISVLLNGIPISGLTSGSMYWNNWMGLGDATSSIQLQKGIGNSMLSDNSVGGTINIITTRPSETAGSEIGFSQTGYGTSSSWFTISSGALKKGWNLSLMGSRNWGSSYPDCTDLSTWSYYIIVSKRLNGRNSINFTSLGSPEKHQQRSTRLSYADVEKHGRNYNRNWGWDIDEYGRATARTLSQNTYFKPYFTLTHTYDNGSGVKAVSTAYLAIADGGGFYTESTGRRIASFLTPDGQIDWKAVREYNGEKAENIMTDYLAGHTQFGLKTNMIADLSDRIQIDAGLHFQSYDTWEKERITDLLGAEYWYEDYEHNSLAGLNGRNPIKKVGDYVRTHNGREQRYVTLYSLGTIKAGAKKSNIITIGASLSGTILRRWDAYNYSSDEMWSGWTGRAGGSVKGGMLKNFSPSNSLYANAAVYSRAPYASVFFSSGNNSVSRDISNEKNYLGEIGYRRTGSRFTAEATAYAALWKDKSLTSPSYKSLDEEPFKFMLQGLDALHVGMELNATYRISRMLKAEAYASLGEWKWLKDVDATIYDPQTMRPIDEIHVFSKGLHIGDAPQTQVGASINSSFSKGFSAGISWSHNDRIWADFEPATRTDPEFRSDSYRLPGYSLIDATASWHHEYGRIGMTVFLNINNIADASYIERGKDGTGHDKATVTGYWGNGRNFNFGVRMNLLPNQSR